MVVGPPLQHASMLIPRRTRVRAFYRGLRWLEEKQPPCFLAHLNLV